MTETKDGALTFAPTTDPDAHLARYNAAYQSLTNELRHDQPLRLAPVEVAAQAKRELVGYRVSFTVPDDLTAKFPPARDVTDRRLHLWHVDYEVAVAWNVTARNCGYEAITFERPDYDAKIVGSYNGISPDLPDQGMVALVRAGFLADRHAWRALMGKLGTYDTRRAFLVAYDDWKAAEDAAQVARRRVAQTLYALDPHSATEAVGRHDGAPVPPRNAKPMPAVASPLLCPVFPLKPQAEDLAAALVAGLAAIQKTKPAGR